MKIGLGTVQLGMNYGVSNTTGKPSAQEAERVLKKAVQSGIVTFDTAPRYGDSESILGEYLPATEELRVVTKTAVTSAMNVADLLDELKASLAKLKRRQVYGYLVHNVDELQRHPWIVTALQEARQTGLTKKIGVSVYEANDIDRALALFKPDIIQLPLNVFDQRLLASGHLARLKKEGIETHVRSVFLQGLVLMTPEYAEQSVPGSKVPVGKFQTACRSAGVSPLAGALSFLLANRDVDVVLTGACSEKELTEILAAAEKPVTMNFAAFAVMNEAIVLPTRWAKKAS